MQIEDMPFMKSMIRLCMDAWQMGWHERNAGNLSYRLTPDEVAECEPGFFVFGEEHAWRDLGRAVPCLAAQHLCVSGAGRLFRNAADGPAQTFGIVEVSEDGARYRVVWGLEGGRPTSEFPTHLLAHAARMRAAASAQGVLEADAPCDRVVYHAHCPNVIALSNILEPDSRIWTRTLWQTMTECILFFPEGVGAVPWMVPGGYAIARASEELLERFSACVWTQHGLFTTGASCEGAFGLAHMIEKTAGICLQGRAACGGQEPPFYVSDDQLRQICSESGVVPNRDFLD